jgi:phosphatidate cytidylyltransferase
VLRTRILTALVALPLLFLVIVHPYRPVFAGVVVGACAAAAYEFFTMAFPTRWLHRLAGVVLSILVAAGVAAQRPELWGLGIASGVAAGLLFCLIDADDMVAAVARAGHLALGIVYSGFLLAHLVLLRGLEDGQWWVLMTILVGMGSDTGGYFTGRYLGRHPLAPRVSPKKTVEGAAGGLVGGLIAVALIRSVFFQGPTWVEVIFLGLAMSTLSQLGDLTESMFKRAFGAKDSGWIIPGHGGILDRVDSLVFPAIFSYYYAVLVYA